MQITQEIRNALKQATETIGDATALASKTKIDVSLISRYAKGEVKRMTVETWSKLQPCLERYLTKSNQHFIIWITADFVYIAEDYIADKNCWYGAKTIQDAIRYAQEICNICDKTPVFKLLPVDDLRNSQIDLSAQNIPGNNVRNVGINLNNDFSTVRLAFNNFNHVAISIGPNTNPRE